MSIPYTKPIVSLVVNTCAGGVKAAKTLSSGKQPHAQRSFALRNFILPAALADPKFDEVIVVGEWEPGNGYIYIEVPSVHFSCVDALAQRQAGFERSTGGFIVFQHDDHILAPDVGRRLQGSSWVNGGVAGEIGVLIPSRYTRLRNVNGERLNNGAPSPGGPEGNINPYHLGFVSGHCAIYRREVLEKCPWGDVDKVHTWDCAHTRQIRDAGFSIKWSDALCVHDCEAGAKPWS